MNATDLKTGTRVTTSVGKYAGRTGTVNGVDAGEVTIPGHENFGRQYIGVNWDAVPGDMGCDRRSRPFVDELTIVQAAPLPTLEDVEFWTDEADREDARREAAGCTCPRGESELYAAHHRTVCEPTWQTAQFDAFAVGDRIRFQTIDNGFGGSGDFIMREGVVTAVTARTLRVDCGPGPFGSRAVLTRANWYHRDPHKAATR